MNDSVMLGTMRDDTWNMLNMQHITPNSKKQDYSDISGGGHKKTNGALRTKCRPLVPIDMA